MFSWQAFETCIGLKKGDTHKECSFDYKGITDVYLAI